LKGKAMSVTLNAVRIAEPEEITFDKMKQGVLYYVLGDYEQYKDKIEYRTLFTKSLAGTLVWFENGNRVGQYPADRRRFIEAPAGTEVRIVNK
jgi:hypothetical protein